MGYLSFDSADKARYYEYQLKRHSDKKNKFIQIILKKRVSDPEVLQPPMAAPDRREV